ncbi:hypothetical protein AB0H71_09890 [Nocardia sp. NPDC050697]|uniref:hypothetical protein n=1 Tax=Nocardia sp. NPDC050697 TaxID=3155158 RepID=UPI00340DB4D2
MTTPATSRRSPESWIEQRVGWILAATPVLKPEDNTGSGEPTRVHDFYKMTPQAAARALDRIDASRRLTHSALPTAAAASGTPGTPWSKLGEALASQLSGTASQVKPIVDPEAGSVLDDEGFVVPQPGTVPNPGAGTRPPGDPKATPPPPATQQSTPPPPPPPAPNSAGAQTQPLGTGPGTAQPAPAATPGSTSMATLDLLGVQAPLEPGQSRVLPTGYIMTANPDGTTSVSRSDPKTGAIHTDVMSNGVVISTAVSQVVPGTNGMSRDTVITDARGTSQVRSASNGAGGVTTWTANPDGTHSVQYPDGTIIRERARAPIEVVQLSPDGLSGRAEGVNSDGTTYAIAFRPGIAGPPTSDIAISDGSRFSVTTVRGLTNGELLSIVTRPDSSRSVVYPDGTAVPIDRYNNAIGSPNYGNQFDPFTGTWRSDPFHRRGPITTKPDGTSEQEWFSRDADGAERKSLARFDAAGNLVLLETLDYTGLAVRNFETFDGVTVPSSSNFLDSGRVEDESAMVFEAIFMFTGVPSLGTALARTITTRLLTRQLAAQGTSRAGIELALGNLGLRSETAFLGSASARGVSALSGGTGLADDLTRFIRPLPPAGAYAPTGALDAAIVVLRSTTTRYHAIVDGGAASAVAIKRAAMAGISTPGTFPAETAVLIRAIAQRIRDYSRLLHARSRQLVPSGQKMVPGKGEDYVARYGRGPFPNQMADRLDDELARADAAGIRPRSPEGREFDDMINSGERIKWAVTTNGELRVIPHDIPGYDEVPHSVLVREGSVLAAGEAQIAGNATDGYIGLEITPHSGHFQPSLESLEVGREAFQRYGIIFFE